MLHYRHRGVIAMSAQNLVFENDHFSLVVGADAIVKELRLKATNEDCLDHTEEISLFSLTEDRPYNNEIKLAHPNKRTTFEANRLRREGNRLIVGFEQILFEAAVEVTITNAYISFTLSEFIVPQEAFDGLAMSPPPVAEFRLLQLPIRNREHFGEWLNVMWDDSAAINVLGTGPFTKIDSHKRKTHRLLTADAVRELKLEGCSAALIAAPVEKLLDCIDAVEQDYALPHGVVSRRNTKDINSSIYWTDSIAPQNVEAQIALAKQMGFKKMLIFYSAFCKNDVGYDHCGDYEFNDAYPNGSDDLKVVLEALRHAGITPGMHILHTHIGIKSRYVTPIADHRLHLTRHFTLAKPLSNTDTEIYVSQNPRGTVMHPQCRVLKFGGELIEYTAYTTIPPYRFTGCKRGHFDTTVTAHDVGTIGGVLDISEFGATSVYIDQDTDLQDEIADKIAALYDLGFEFLYFDGSEGTNAPFEFYIPYAQYRIYQKLKRPPLFCEGAAKAHFSWHMLSGGNAFDVCLTRYFKGNLLRHQLPEAQRMADDFTRINFGWWGLFDDSQPHLFEYGTSKAAAWSAPVTIYSRLPRFYTALPHSAAGARSTDNYEVLRRWENVREQRLLTDEQLLALRDPDTEYTLLINEDGQYELVRYYPLNTPDHIIAYTFDRRGRTYVVYWHPSGEDNLQLPQEIDDLRCEKTLGLPLTTAENQVPLSDKHYVSTQYHKELLIAAFSAKETIA